MMMRMLFVMMDSDGDGTVSLQEFEVPVTKFLRDALTVEALGVPKLEAMARAAGLLGEGQRITQAKLFRQRSQSEQQPFLINEEVGDAGEERADHATITIHVAAAA